MFGDMFGRAANTLKLFRHCSEHLARSRDVRKPLGAFKKHSGTAGNISNELKLFGIRWGWSGVHGIKWSVLGCAGGRWRLVAWCGWGGARTGCVAPASPTIASTATKPQMQPQPEPQH